METQTPNGQTGKDRGVASSSNGSSHNTQPFRKSNTFTSLNILKKLSFGRTSPRVPPPPTLDNKTSETVTKLVLDGSDPHRHRSSSVASLRRGSIDGNFREKIKESDDMVTTTLIESRDKVDKIVNELLPALIKTSTSTSKRLQAMSTLAFGLAMALLMMSMTHVIHPTFMMPLSAFALTLCVVAAIWARMIVSSKSQALNVEQRAVINMIGAIRSDLVLSLSHVQARTQTVVAALTVVEEEVAAVVTGSSHNVPPKYKPEGLRLNCFSGLPNLNFVRDVLEKLTPEQQATYGKFHVAFEKAYISNVPTEIRDSPVHEKPDEFTELRFLQADHYNIDKAVDRLCGTLKWRHNTGLNNLVHTPNIELLERSSALRPRIIAGLDKHSRPLMVERLGEFFGSDVAYRGLHIDDWIVTYGYEIGEVTSWIRMAVEQGAPYHHRMAYIGDLHGLRTMTALRMLPFLKTLVAEVEMHFPELSGPVFLINAPSSLARLWGLVKKFLDPNTAEKIKIVSGPGHDILISALGEHNVPMAYGGSNPIFVPACPKELTSDFDIKFPLSVSYAGKIGRGGGKA